VLPDERDNSWLPATLLGRLERNAREELLGLGRRTHVGPRHSILREGQRESHVVLLHQAVAKVTAAMRDGRQALLAIRVSGDIVGEISALNGTPRSATVTSCGRSLLAVIHREEFRAFLRRNPDAALAIAGMEADRLRWANRRRIDFASYPVKVRLARILVEIATTYGVRTPVGLVVRIYLTQQDLATLCGAADVTLQRSLSELRKAGVVDTGYRRIAVLDEAALEEIAGVAWRADD
jgi:CRP/FNR family cyclic AMP-dependent transcriptional regulator